jgi:hypothetical protein
MFWGNFAWVDAFHAVNPVVTSDGVLRLIEPKSDEIHAASECISEADLIVV